MVALDWQLQVRPPHRHQVVDHGLQVKHVVTDGQVVFQAEGLSITLSCTGNVSRSSSLWLAGGSIRVFTFSLIWPDGRWEGWFKVLNEGQIWEDAASIGRWGHGIS